MAGVTLDVTVFGRSGCHLCDIVEAEIRSMKEIKANLVIIDIEGNPTLHDRYWMRIPVVAVRGREVFEARMMDLDGRWKGRLPSLLSETGPPPG